MDKIHVLYDHEIFTLQQYGGISNCFAQLISNLPSDIDAVLGLRYTQNYHLLHSKINFHNTWVLKKNNYHIPHKWGYSFLEKHLESLFHTPENMTSDYTIRLMRQGNYDIFHATYFNPHFLQYNKKPFVMTVHDMIPEIYNIYKQQIECKSILIKKAAHIITVSECTKHDLMRISGVPEDRITVIYHGFEHREIPTQKSIINHPYILYVGARYQYKNFDYFISQVLPFLYKHTDFHIVCTGTKFSTEETEMLKQHGLSDRITHKFCTNEELDQLYAHAFAFVYPSKYEGFGLPILEAFHANCPVILNNKSCFPEVAQDAALYFDSDSESDTLLSQLEKLYDMPENEKLDLLSRGKKRLSFFSWKKASEQLAEVYRKVHASRS